MDVEGFLRELREDEVADLICLEIEEMCRRNTELEELHDYVGRILGENDGRNPSRRIHSEIQRVKGLA